MIALVLTVLYMIWRSCLLAHACFFACAAPEEYDRGGGDLTIRCTGDVYIKENESWI